MVGTLATQLSNFAIEHNFLLEVTTFSREVTRALVGGWVGAPVPALPSRLNGIEMATLSTQRPRVSVGKLSYFYCFYKSNVNI